MHFEDTKIFGFNQYQKSDKTPVVVYADLVYLIETIYRCKNDSENYSTTKVAEHIPWNFSVPSTFEIIKYKNKAYIGQDCIKKLVIL